MSATNVSTANVSADDSVKGEIEFRGTVGNKIEEKTDKKGNPYLVFSAFSSEKDGEGYSFTWVRFMHFGQGKPEWMQGNGRSSRIREVKTMLSSYGSQEELQQ